MSLAFILLVVMTLAGAVAAMTLPRLIHCALALALAFTGLAALYVTLGAEFAGLAQLLVYVGAVAILIVFAIMLTRGAELRMVVKVTTPAVVSGMIVALTIFGLLAWCILSSNVGVHSAIAPAPQSSVRDIGLGLVQHYVLQMEVMALMLTATLIGAVILAMRDEPLALDEDSTKLGTRA